MTRQPPKPQGLEPQEPSHMLRVLQRAARESRWLAVQRGESTELVHGTPLTEGEWKFVGTRCVERPEETNYACGLPANADVLGRVVREHITCPKCRAHAEGKP